jgi:hypothetical protein
MDYERILAEETAKHLHAKHPWCRSLDVWELQQDYDRIWRWCAQQPPELHREKKR